MNDTLMIENAHIIFRNFSGKESHYNKAGDRNFCLIIANESEAARLRDEGWNIRSLAAREEGDREAYYLPVSVSFKHIPPKIYLITRKRKVLMTEETVGELDYADISNVDLIVRPRHWTVKNESGVKAYLKTMYVTIEEDAFAEKYIFDEDVPF